MMVNLSKLSFYSGVNYLKRSKFVGSKDLSLFGGEGGHIATHTVSHSLGYVPFFIVGANISNNSIIWSNNYVHELTVRTGEPPDLPAQLEYWCTETELTVRLRNGTGSYEINGTRTVYWAIYLDYGS